MEPYIGPAITAAQAINRAIDGVKTAPEIADYPAQIHDVECPYVITWPAAGTWGFQSIGQKRNDLTLIITVFLAPVGSGIRGEIIQAAIDLLDKFLVAYMTPAAHSLAGTIEHSTSLTNQGVQIIPFAGVDWYGFQIRYLGVAKSPGG